MKNQLSFKNVEVAAALVADVVMNAMHRGLWAYVTVFAGTGECVAGWTNHMPEASYYAGIADIRWANFGSWVGQTVTKDMLPRITPNSLSQANTAALALCLVRADEPAPKNLVPVALIVVSAASGDEATSLVEAAGATFAEEYAAGLADALAATDA